MLTRWLCGLLLAGAGMAAQAQVAPYAMLSLGRESGPNVGASTPAGANGSMDAKGGTVGVYDDFLKLGPAKLGSDGRLIIANSGNAGQYGDKLLGGLFGLRLDAGGVPMLPVNPYIQAEVGVVGSNNGTNATRSTSFAYQVQVGGDFSIFPHVAVRGEYGAGQMTSIGGTSRTLQTFGVGLVVRL